MSKQHKIQSQSGYFWSSMTGTVVNIDHKDDGLERRLSEGLPAMNEKAWQMCMSLFGDSPQI
jgi:CTP:molybdopterin cytidylyltransferase MocA